MTDDKLPDFEVIANERPRSADERAELLAEPGFGSVFTDHMFTMRWSADRGWHSARVEPFGPLTLSPATAVLHYAQEIFEGLKAYHRSDGTVGLFRPEANAQRFNGSARRLAMPELPEKWFLASIRELISVDRDWVPTEGESSLYVRPFMIATESFLGVRPSQEYLYGVITSPAGAYFKTGPKPVTLWVSEDYTRAAPGGTGAAKCGGNYAASLAPHSQAIEKGCDQVVFLDAVEHKYIDELGGMNLFFVYGDEKVIYTPRLTGSILPGITRDAIITLLSEEGWDVHETDYSLEKWRADAQSGRLTETFACGTAAVITPVGMIREQGGEFSINESKTGELTRRLRSRILDIQHGRAEDTHNWTQTIE
ncbi:branched-chain amino acid aminotransferase [Haloglycomyces albus]|uniref:branched-chain amino acid aminotransferase n=1 Tax=Haloglycomyces albus TaxID=526067 RepID=UPI00046CE920|nr:branched-chain amino acid aminotransferase [Haloglycomyces albus]